MQINRSAILALIFSLTMPIALHAQDFRVEDLFLGYSLSNGNLQKHASGWEISGGYYLKQWLSLHADFDAHHQSSGAGQRHQHDFLFGPQFSHRTDHFTLFTHSLSGITHVNGSLGKETGFGTVAGGGIDWDINPAIAVRVVQADYHSARLFGAFQNDARFSFGVVIRLIGFGDPVHPPSPPPGKKPSETP